MYKQTDDVVRDLKTALAALKEASERTPIESPAEDDNALRERFLTARANFIAVAKEDRNKPSAGPSPEEVSEEMSPKAVGDPISRVGLDHFFFG